CLDKYNISTWENIVLTLTNLCLKVWQIHARNNNSQCQCLVKDQQAIDQICEHYHLLNDLNDDGRLIINGILNVLGKRFRFPFGQITERRRLNTLNSDNNTQIKITNKLDEILNQILINFIQTKFSSIT
ncbi:unnamed protein product, partial [Rotaria sordida]